MGFQRILITTIILLGVTISAHAQRNPGQSAMQCVDATERNGEVFFTNTCNQDIFVVWCFTGTDARGRCGNGPAGGGSSGYYVRSRNIEPGSTSGAGIDKGGRLRYAACVGKISFGNEGHFEDDSNGGFRCLRR